MSAADLSGLTALVTGGASGIGLASAQALMAAGAEVGVLDVDVDALPAGLTALEADVTDTAAVDGAVNGFGGAHGRIDVLVNNAGISFVGGIEAGTEEDWRRLFDINVFGQMRVMRAALPWLRRSPAASVIVMSSCAAINAIPDRVAYSSSKGAVHAMAMALAADLVGENIRVNCIAPATVATPFMDRIIDRADDPAMLRASLRARQPTGRMIDPGEIGHAVVYLASPAAMSSTGTVLVVDGGMGTIRQGR